MVWKDTTILFNSNIPQKCKLEEKCCAYPSASLGHQTNLLNLWRRFLKTSPDEFWLHTKKITETEIKFKKKKKYLKMLMWNFKKLKWKICKLNYLTLTFCDLFFETGLNFYKLSWSKCCKVLLCTMCTMYLRVVLFSEVHVGWDGFDIISKLPSSFFGIWDRHRLRLLPGHSPDETHS